LKRGVSVFKTVKNSYTLNMQQAYGSILITLAPERTPEGILERVRPHAGGRPVLLLNDRDEIEKVLPGVEIIAGEFPAALLTRAPALKWYQSWYAGADWIQKFPEVKDLPIALTIATGIHGVQMTEHLFGMLFAWNRRFPVAFAAQPRHEWARFRHPDMDVLAGKTMLIVGYGTIGERIARAARVFDMQVIGLRRKAATKSADIPVQGMDKLPELLGQADVVVNILPLTPETRNLFGVKEFGCMKRTALFANIGRGGTVVEDDLAAVLREHRIGGALLDVTATEPLQTDSPLWDLENVLLTSHYSGFHPRYDEMALGVFLDNLDRYVRGEALRNQVDPQKGY